MSKKQKTPINVLRVLDLCINDPAFSKNFDDFIKLREQTTEFRIRDALRLLERENILISEYKRGRPRQAYAEGSQSGRYDHKFGSKIYQLNLDLDTFKKLFNIFYDEDCEAFLKSNYVTLMIGKHTLKELYRQLDDQFRNQHFRHYASRILLDSSAAIKEYEFYSNKIYNYLQQYKDFGLRDLWFFDEIQILENFDPITSIPFIRSHLKDNLMDLYKKIGGRNIHLRSPDGLRLMKLDMHLSPFFSYPFFDPIQVIFSKPFDRLYDDIYIFNKEDFKLMAERIYLVYKNFAEFLAIFLSTVDWRYSMRLESSLREYLFLWNCQSCYFDEIYYDYNFLFDKGSISHITSSSGFIQIIDLAKNIKLLNPEESYSIKSKITYPPLFTEGKMGGSSSNPFEVLIPCRSLFDKFGFDATEIPFDALLEELTEKIK
jgi:hypothetical protein